MLQSFAYRELSLSGHRVLARIELELAAHGGTSNGKLPVTYGDFVEYGVHRHAISSAIRECEALGFLKVTEQGRSGAGDVRTPNRFLLTYRHTDRDDPTEDWRAIKTAEMAAALSKAAREVRPKNKTPVMENALDQYGNHHHKPGICGAETITTGPVRKPSLLSISRVGGGTVSSSSLDTHTVVSLAGGRRALPHSAEASPPAVGATTLGGQK